MPRAVLALALCLPSAAVPAAPTGIALLEKATETGYVLPENAVSMRCVIKDNGRMSITSRAAGFSSTREIALTLNLTDLKAAITDAASGEINEDPMPADVPAEIYTAYQNRGKMPVLLLEQKSDSGVRKVNESLAAKRLRKFMDVNCDSPAQTPK